MPAPKPSGSSIESIGTTMPTLKTEAEVHAYKAIQSKFQELINSQ